MSKKSHLFTKILFKSIAFLLLAVYWFITFQVSNWKITELDDVALVYFISVSVLIFTTYVSYQWIDRLLSNKFPKMDFRWYYLLKSLLAFISITLEIALAIFLIQNLFRITSGTTFLNDGVLSNALFIFLVWNIWYLIKRYYQLKSQTTSMLLLMALLVFFNYLWLIIHNKGNRGLLSLDIYDTIDFLVVAYLLVLSFLAIQHFLQSQNKPWLDNLSDIQKFVLTFLVYWLIVLSGYTLYFRIVYDKWFYELFWSWDVPILTSLILFFNFAIHWRIAPEIHSPKKNELHQNKKNVIDALVVKVGKVVTKIPLEKIAILYIEDKVVFGETLQGKKYVLDQSLNDLEQVLPSSSFFRTNRQLILSRNIITQFKSEQNQKLKVTYQLPNQTESVTIISRYKSPEFKKWFR